MSSLQNLGTAGVRFGLYPLDCTSNPPDRPDSWPSGLKRATGEASFHTRVFMSSRMPGCLEDTNCVDQEKLDEPWPRSTDCVLWRTHAKLRTTSTVYSRQPYRWSTAYTCSVVPMNFDVSYGAFAWTSSTTKPSGMGLAEVAFCLRLAAFSIFGCDFAARNKHWNFQCSQPRRSLPFTLPGAKMRLETSISWRKIYNPSSKFTSILLVENTCHNLELILAYFHHYLIGP